MKLLWTRFPGVLSPWHAAPAVRNRATHPGGAKAWATATLHRAAGGGAYTLTRTVGELRPSLRVMACACESGARVQVLEEDNARLRRDVVR